MAFRRQALPVLTADQGLIAKLVSHSLHQAAPKVQKFLENFDLDIEALKRGIPLHCQHTCCGMYI